MNRINYYLVTFIATVAAMTSCEEQIIESTTTDETTGTRITIGAERVNNDTPESKSAISGTDFTWKTNDYLSVCANAAAAGYITAAPFKLADASDGQRQGNFTGVLTNPNGHVYAVYPHKDDKKFSKTSSSMTYTFDLPVVQEQKHLGVDGGAINTESLGSYAYMYGKSTGIVTTENHVAMSMSQIMTIIDFKISDIDANTKIHSLTFRGATSIFPCSLTVDLDKTVGEEGFITNVDLAKIIEVNLTGKDGASGVKTATGELTIRLAMFPHTFVQNQTLYVELATSDNGGEHATAVHIHTKEFTADKTYESSKRYDAPLALGTDFKQLIGDEKYAQISGNGHLYYIYDRNVGDDVPTTYVAENWIGDLGKGFGNIKFKGDTFDYSYDKSTVNHDLCPPGWFIPETGQELSMLQHALDISSSGVATITDERGVLSYFPLDGNFSAKYVTLHEYGDGNHVFVLYIAEGQGNSFANGNGGPFLARCLKKAEQPGEDEVDMTYQEPRRFNPNRLFIKHGLQTPCWFGNATVLKEDWNASGFSGPAFAAPPLYHKQFFDLFPNSQWSMVKGPYGRRADEGGGVTRMPTPREHRDGFLSVQQTSKLDNLVNILFGDEDYLHTNPGLVDNLREWYSVTRKHYPDVLVNNNQYALQWTTTQLRDYVKRAKPDLLTFDTYMFTGTDDLSIRRSTFTAEYLMTYRKIAMEGWDGTGKDYIAFGQFCLGFENGNHRITEAQLRLYYFMTWTFGGKWVNWFRWLQGADKGDGAQEESLCLLLENGQPGQQTKHMTWINECNTESHFIGDHLVRLLSTKIYYKMGTAGYSDPNGKPETDQMGWESSFPDLIEFSKGSRTIPIKELSGIIKGTNNSAGDLYLGFFDIIPSSEQGDPSFFKNPDAQFFMITNSYSTNNQNTTAADLSQTITFKVREGPTVSWFNPYTLKEEVLTKKSSASRLDTYEVELWGGTGALFYLEE